MDNKIFDLLVVFFAVLTLALSGIRARTEKAEYEAINVVQPNGRFPASVHLAKVNEKHAGSHGWGGKKSKP